MGGIPRTSPSNLRRTVHASGWMYFSKALLFGWALLLTHQFGIADYGVFAMAFALATLIGTPLDSYFTVRAPRVDDGTFDGERTTRVFIGLGLAVLWREASRRHLAWSGKMLAGTLLLTMVPGVLAAQVKRMLQDPKADALSTRFGSQWLRLQDLDKIHPDALLFPYYDHNLAAALKKETELFFDSVVREDRNIVDLIRADYTFVNERIANHYGLQGVNGPEFRRVTLTDENRRGLLGHGSILALTSVADRTSPVLRGKWIMEVLLGSPPPPPPPNVPALEETKAVDAGKVLSVRERMEEHRKNPACTSCHKVIDPLGLALENFDVTGVWRIKDAGVAIDPVGDLYDGTRLDGPIALRNGIDDPRVLEVGAPLAVPQLPYRDPDSGEVYQ